MLKLGVRPNLSEIEAGIMTKKMWFSKGFKTLFQARLNSSVMLVVNKIQMIFGQKLVDLPKCGTGALTICYWARGPAIRDKLKIADVSTSDVDTS